MEHKPREIVDICGIKSYFFPNLVNYIKNNGNLLISNPEKANSFASHVLGISKGKPSEQDIVTMLVPENDSPDTLVARIDLCLLLGDKFRPHLEAAAKKLTELGRSHDILPIMDDEKKLALLARKAKLRKTIDAKILLSLVKIISSKDAIDKFQEVAELCQLDLDFDAFVLVNALDLKTEDTSEEVDIIYENVLNLFESYNPMLKQLMIEGPKEPLDEFTQLLLSPLENGVIDETVKRVVERFNEASKDEGDESLVLRSQFGYQLVFLVVRSLAAGQRETSKAIQSLIPAHIRAEVFPGLQKSVYKSAVFLAHHIIRVFLETTNSFEDWSIVGIDKDLENTWKRRAIAELLKKYSISITEKCFSVEVPLLPQNELSNEVVVEKVMNALRFALWITEFYGFESDPKSIDELKFLNISSKNLLINSFKKFVQGLDSKSHVLRIIASLERYGANEGMMEKVVSSADAPSSTSLVSNKQTMIYTREEVAFAHKTESESTKAQILQGLSNSNSAGLLIDSSNSINHREIPFDEIDSAGAYNNVKEIGQGVVVKAQATLENPENVPEISKTIKCAEENVSQNQFEESNVGNVAADEWDSPSKSVALSMEVQSIDEEIPVTQDEPETSDKAPQKTLEEECENVDILQEQERARTAWGSGDVTPIPLATPTNAYKVSGFAGATLAKGFGQFSGGNSEGIGCGGGGFRSDRAGRGGNYGGGDRGGRGVRNGSYCGDRGDRGGDRGSRENFRGYRSGFGEGDRRGGVF